MAESYSTQDLVSRTRALAASAPLSIKEKQQEELGVTLSKFTYEEIKKLEMTADEWLKANKHLQTLKPATWYRASLKYQKIVKILNAKHDEWIKKNFTGKPITIDY